MSFHFVSTQELKPMAIMVLKQYQQTRRIDLSMFLAVLHGYENRYNVLHSTIDQLIKNPKSKYHLLYSLSGAIHFQSELLPTKILTTWKFSNAFY